MKKADGLRWWLTKGAANLRRFFIDTPLLDEMSIEGLDAHHISRVLRLPVGHRIIVVSPDGSSGIARIDQIAVDKVIVTLQETVVEDKEAPVTIYLAQGLPKSDKMDYIVQKAVELGVKGIYPLELEHCVVHNDHAKKIPGVNAGRRVRWRLQNNVVARSFLPWNRLQLCQLYSRALLMISSY